MKRSTLLALSWLLVVLVAAAWANTASALQFSVYNSRHIAANIALILEGGYGSLVVHRVEPLQSVIFNLTVPKGLSVTAVRDYGTDEEEGDIAAGYPSVDVTISQPVRDAGFIRVFLVDGDAIYVTTANAVNERVTVEDATTAFTLGFGLCVLPFCVWVAIRLAKVGSNLES